MCKRCMKKRGQKRGQILPHSVPGMNGDKKILYSFTEKSSVRVFELGLNCGEMNGGTISQTPQTICLAKLNKYPEHTETADQSRVVTFRERRSRH